MLFRHNGAISFDYWTLGFFIADPSSFSFLSLSSSLLYTPHLPPSTHFIPPFACTPPFSLPRHLAALWLLYSQVGSATVGFKHRHPVSLLFFYPSLSVLLPPLSLWQYPFPANRLLMKRRRVRGMRGRWSTLLLLLWRSFFLWGGCTSFLSL